MKTKKKKRSTKVKPLLFIIGFAVVGLLSLILVKAATIYTPPGTIAADCSVDVTSALNSWLASVPNGSTIEFKSNGCYQIDGTLTLTNRHSLVLNGQGATFKAFTTGDRTRSQWSTNGGNYLTFENMIIRGANPNAGTGDSAYVASLEAQHAFNIIATRYVNITNNQAYDLYGDFVYFGNNSSGWAGNATVFGNHFDRNGRQGISITGGDHINIVYNYIYDVRRTVFDIEPNTTAGGAFDITINNNSIGPHRLNFFSDQGAAGNVHDITFENNVSKGGSMNMTVRPPSGRRKNFFFINNTSDHDFGSSIGAAATFSNIDNLQFKDNTQPLQTGRNMALVKLNSVSGLVMSGNTLVGGTKLYIGSGITTTSICGNRFSSTGSFSYPVKCAASTPPPKPTPTPNPTPVPNPTKSKTSTLSGGQPMPSLSSSGAVISPKKTIANSAESDAKSVVTAPIKSLKDVSSYVTDSKLPIWARILAGIAFILILAMIVITLWFISWLLKTYVFRKHSLYFK